MIPASFTIVLAIALAPFTIFCFGLLEPVPGLIAAALAFASAVPIVRRTEWRSPPQRGLLAAAFAVASLLTLVSGVGHLFWQTDDWTMRDALLLDLVRHPWPVNYALDGAAGLLRAPIGMYLTPALVGKALGPRGAEWALFAQNASLLALLLYTLARTFPADRAKWIAIGLFVAFSGLDSLAWAKRAFDGVPDNLLLPHLDPWPGIFQYTSHVTQFFWVPHHALAGWTTVAGYQLWRTGRMPALLIGPAWAASVFWSPLAAAGAIPFLVFAFVCDLRDGKFRIGDFVPATAAGISIAPVLIYLTRDSAGVEKGFLDYSDPVALQAYAGLILVKVLPWLAVAWEALDPRDRRARPELVLIAAILLALPVYKIGIANDFVMRVSIPALALLCMRVVPALATLDTQPVRRRALLVGIVALGAVTPAVEIVRNATQPATPTSACNVAEVIEDGPYTPRAYYLASPASFDSFPSLFRKATTAPVPMTMKNCWPGRRFVYQQAPK